ncbi:Scr1 family TA system antitoxin-like transcriptional regulator [Streptomyces sp. NPDC057950]|uniref:Scr1 family TA system antitoxin-like transcriptional regulator n=1 Tax=Streptomyces sp. NPDC057950 TaxID=3346288 RepID=UPI0036E321DF
MVYGIEGGKRIPQPEFLDRADEAERMVAARTARQSVVERAPAPVLSFVPEEAAPRRPIGGTIRTRPMNDRRGGTGSGRSTRGAPDPTRVRT